MRNLILSPESVEDAHHAYDWYESQRPGLGEEFLQCLEAKLERIHRSPEIFAIEYEDYRRALLRRFPYAILYRATDDAVTVYGVFHTSSDPMKWRLRTSQ